MTRQQVFPRRQSGNSLTRHDRRIDPSRPQTRATENDAVSLSCPGTIETGMVASFEVSEKNIQPVPGFVFARTELSLLLGSSDMHHHIYTSKFPVPGVWITHIQYHS